jgi:hypothetical protein
MSQHDKKDNWEPAYSADDRSSSGFVVAFFDRTSGRRYEDSKNRQ